MSRRPNPDQDRIERNRATLKSLVKLEANKSCADCKRNKHPRWASWNLGIFVCIRCSGIHRGMGTHISRVKSVDLDSWTDEQLQNMLRWGNGRANKYWEAKLAPGHVPSESKIENFIRTKYESKRWAMEGGMPDPSTLSDATDDDVPLNVVQEKAKLERSTSQRTASSAMPKPRAANIDLFGDDTPQRPSTVEPQTNRPPPPKSQAAPPRQTKQADSLLGLDFFGTSNSAPISNATSPPPAGVPSRPDLKQSILSLYAAKPAAPPQQHQRQPSQGSFGTLTSPSSPPATQSGVSGLDDAFSGLSFSNQPSAPPAPTASPFDALSSLSPRSSVAAPQTTKASAFGTGGGFFDAPKPAPATTQPVTSIPQGNLGGFGDIFSSTSPPPSQAPKASQADLFDIGFDSAPAPPPKQTTAAPNISSAFNLSKPTAAPVAPKPQTAPLTDFSGFSGMDAWGSNNAWATDPAPAAKPAAAPAAAPAASTIASDFGGWGITSEAKPTPQVAQDEDFGGWNSAAPETPGVGNSGAKQKASAGGFGGQDDLFGNVWK
ncbi:ArfGap-domain-containing protein [Eremomyces bilateralis CBS 781.70]|uniref:ArfGap-domain-containing protein n=1 Tax=Eremomyces bilateralis CBS 781.70 TaxID=1392243 RepID=A0A6G1FQL3_9PEZI|nr:ArfGap-domain-containing protein [Eremomyces bilateralis CBS 781.70]KAF1807979.1 ArfGap-domain-containing protein [Eremomyces bilateralis CBS 781.70]